MENKSITILHTFWSASGSMYEQSYGWISPEYHLMSWALSCLLSKQFTGRINLYADSHGLEVLAHDIGLPYDNLINIDEFVQKTDEHYWALAKLHTCAAQVDPFLHIDGDVFIWGPLQKEISEHGIIVQNAESSEKAQRLLFQKYLLRMSGIPECLNTTLPKVDEIIGYNTGILGGNNFFFFKNLYDTAQYIISSFGEHNSNFEKGNFNMFFEQHLCYRLALHHDYPVYSHLKTIIPDQGYIGFADFHLVPGIKQYLHLIGNYKKDLKACRGLANTLRYHFPEVYYKIVSLFLKKGVPLFQNCYISEAHLNNEIGDYSGGNDIMKAFLIDLKTVQKDQPLEAALSYCKDKMFKKLDLESRLCPVLQSSETFLKEIQVKLEWSSVHNEFGALYLRDCSLVAFQAEVQNFLRDRKSIIVSKNSWWTVIVSDFNWGDILIDKHHKTVLERSKQSVSIIQECFPPYLSFKVLDEFDLYFLECVDEENNLESLIQKTSKFFNHDDLTENFNDFERLFANRLQDLIQNKILSINVL